MIQRGKPKENWLFLHLQQEFFWGKKMGKSRGWGGKSASPKNCWRGILTSPFPGQIPPKFPKFSLKKIPNNQIFAANPKVEGIFPEKRGFFRG